MEKKNQLKISLGTAIAIIVAIIIMVIIIAGGVYFKIHKKEEDINNNIENNIYPQNIVSEENIKNPQEKNTTAEDGYCKIIGNNSDLLYKNDYETDTTHSEKVIFINNDEVEQEGFILGVDDIIARGLFEEEFIRISYNDNRFAIGMSIAYMKDHLQRCFKQFSNKSI